MSPACGVVVPEDAELYDMHPLAGAAHSQEFPELPTPVTPAFVLEGALLALEQCGRLLRDAEHLYNRGSHATAVVLAAYAREELGRERLLLDLWRKSRGGIEVTIEQIDNACKDHEQKQAAGMLSIGLMAEGSSTVLGKLLHRRIHGPPYDEEWKEAGRELDKSIETKKSRTPKERHRQRINALYVGLTSTKKWSRPADIPLRTAYSVVNDAFNDYANEYDRRVVMRCSDDQADLDLFDAFAQLDARARLPKSGWRPENHPFAVTTEVAPPLNRSGTP